MSKYHSYIFNLKKTEADAAELVGRQALDWKKLHAAEVAVADGFVISAAAFDDFITASNLVEQISTLLKQIDEDDTQKIYEVSKEITGLIESANFPSILIQPLLQAYHSLSGINERYVLVRPSWILPSNFVAPIKWQKEVKGEASLLYGVKQAWAQMFTPANLKLRAEKNYTGGLSMAVIVQTFPSPEASGTAFAINSQYDVEILAQLGAYSDKTGSDMYKVLAPSQHIHEKIIYPQPEMRIHKSRMGSSDDAESYAVVSVSSAWQTFQKLPDNVVIKLAQQTIAACKVFGDAIELNWSWETGHLHIFDVSPYFSLPGLKGDNLERKVKKQLKIIEIGTNKKKPIKLNIRRLADEVNEIAANLPSSETHFKEQTIHQYSAGAFDEKPSALDQSGDWRQIRAKLLMTVGLDMSSLSADVLSQADKYDHLYFDATQMVLRNKQLPEQTAQNSSATQELIQKFALELGLLAEVAKGKPIYYQFSDIGKWELEQLNQETDVVIDASERLATDPHALEIEWQAIRLARRDSGLSNIKLVLPRLRNMDELIQIKKMLTGFGFTRTGVSQVWFELALPSALNQLPQLSRGDADGAIIHLPDLTASLLDKEPIGSDLNYAIQAIEQAMSQTKFRIPHLLYMPPNWQIVKRAWQRKLQPQGVTLSRPISVAQLQELVDIESNQPLMDIVTRKPGRPSKSLF